VHLHWPSLHPHSCQTQTTMAKSSTHRYHKSIDRLLKFCYVPATNATSSKAFSLCLLRSLTVLMKQTRQAVCTIKQSILLRCLWLYMTWLFGYKHRHLRKIDLLMAHTACLVGFVSTVIGSRYDCCFDL
jgi:hypothetical protein